jgi:hypothetical protein
METIIVIGLPWLFAGFGLAWVWNRRAKASPKWGVLRTTLSLFVGFMGGAIVGNAVSIAILVLPYWFS